MDSEASCSDACRCEVSIRVSDCLPFRHDLLYEIRRNSGNLCFCCLKRLLLPKGDEQLEVEHFGLRFSTQGDVRHLSYNDPQLEPFFLHYETAEYLSLFLSEEFSVMRLLNRLIGKSVRAQVLALRYPIARKVSEEKDEFLSYELSGEFLSDPPTVEDCLSHVKMEQGERAGVMPLGGDWLDVLSAERRYRSVIGVHFAQGNEKNFEHTMKGLISNQTFAPRRGAGNEEADKSLAIVFLDRPDFLHRSGSPLFELLASLHLYDKAIAEDFLRVVHDISDKIDSKLSRENLSAVDVVLAFESRLKISGERLEADHIQVPYPPFIDVLLVLKPSARGMLHSHLWLMAGFCAYLQPTYVFTLDIDVEPVPGSLRVLEERMETNPRIAALCGQLEIRTEESLNIISGAQWFEFKLAYIMNKSVENTYSFVSTLSPAFSIYRWDYLKMCLCDYFQPFQTPDKLTWTSSNLYNVAPERILSHLLFNSAMREEGYAIEYEKEAVAKVGSILTFQQFLKSKWQLVSGQWFYVLASFWPHRMPKGRMCLYIVFRLYFYVAMLFSFLSVAALYLALSILARSVLEAKNEDSYKYSSATGILQVCYLLIFIVSLLISISRSVERLIDYWKLVMFLYGVLAIFFFSISVVSIYEHRNQLEANMWLGCAGLVIFMLLPVLTKWAPLKSLFFSICYLIMIPSYVNILTAISITKTDELMWTQELPNSTNSKLSEFSRNRTIFINVFIILNVLVGGVLDYFESKEGWPVSYLLLSCSVGFLAVPFALLILSKLFRCLWKLRGFRCKCLSEILNKTSSN